MKPDVPYVGPSRDREGPAATSGSTTPLRLGGVVAALTALLLLQASVAIVAGASSFSVMSAPTLHHWLLLQPAAYGTAYGTALLVEAILMLATGVLCAAGVRWAALAPAVFCGVLGTSYLFTEASGGIWITGIWHHVLGGVEVGAAVLILLPTGWGPIRARQRTALASLLIGLVVWFVIRVPFCWAMHQTGAGIRRNVILLVLAGLLAATAGVPLFAGPGTRFVTQIGALGYAAAFVFLSLTDHAWSWWSGIAPLVVVTAALWVLAAGAGSSDETTARSARADA
ncbi:hypothetical protein [Rudaeicoccus suwonensis]|uniref:hypothetical protein n=1 Tax=Rudaeicoccus suwonensis TaxID=657409 RepID=UPI0011A7B882|nr:hypothetical protein [Rudaeicoccus suwonensis]